MIFQSAPSLGGQSEIATHSEPIQAILDLLQKTYPDAPQAQLRWCRGYYERCASYSGDGGLVAVYFPPAINYVMDLGYKDFVIFKTWLIANIVGDATFPHWEQGKFYFATAEDRQHILFPAVPRDLLVGTKQEITQDVLNQRLQPLGVSVTDMLGPKSFKVSVPAFKETVMATAIRMLPEVDYAERNSIVRVIDILPGWLLDRIF